MQSSFVDLADARHPQALVRLHVLTASAIWYIWVYRNGLTGAGSPATEEAAAHSPAGSPPPPPPPDNLPIAPPSPPPQALPPPPAAARGPTERRLRRRFQRRSSSPPAPLRRGSSPARPPRQRSRSPVTARGPSAGRRPSGGLRPKRHGSRSLSVERPTQPRAHSPVPKRRANRSPEVEPRQPHRHSSPARCSRSPLPHLPKRRSLGERRRNSGSPPPRRPPPPPLRTKRSPERERSEGELSEEGEIPGGAAEWPLAASPAAPATTMRDAARPAQPPGPVRAPGSARAGPARTSSWHSGELRPEMRPRPPPPGPRPPLGPPPPDLGYSQHDDRTQLSRAPGQQPGRGRGGPQRPNQWHRGQQQQQHSPHIAGNGFLPDGAMSGGFPVLLAGGLPLPLPVQVMPMSHRPLGGGGRGVSPGMAAMGGFGGRRGRQHWQG